MNTLRSNANRSVELPTRERKAFVFGVSGQSLESHLNNNVKIETPYFRETCHELENIASLVKNNIGPYIGMPFPEKNIDTIRCY